MLLIGWYNLSHVMESTSHAHRFSHLVMYNFSVDWALGKEWKETILVSLGQFLIFQEVFDAISI